MEHTRTTLEHTTIGFIGYGNMAQAIARGLTAAGILPADRIVACAAHYDKLERATGLIGARPLHTPQEVVDNADVIIVAVKPHQIETLLEPLAPALAGRGRIVVSIAAGWDLERYRALFGDLADRIRVQCTIPNTPMAVGKGVLVTEEANTLDDAGRDLFERIFSPIALIERVDTGHMTIAMVIAGCAPAFTAMYLEALGDAGVEHGLQRAAAYRLAARMIEGVGALHLAEGDHPGVMKDAVCSPGGTTIRGVARLEKDGFRGAVIDGVDAIMR